MIFYISTKLIKIKPDPILVCNNILFKNKIKFQSEMFPPYIQFIWEGGRY